LSPFERDRDVRVLEERSEVSVLPVLRAVAGRDQVRGAGYMLGIEVAADVVGVVVVGRPARRDRPHGSEERPVMDRCTDASEQLVGVADPAGRHDRLQ
jgi:hypothetical protein